jgi:copper type II ascorbate-dependent monooxygenase-like protein
MRTIRPLPLAASSLLACAFAIPTHRDGSHDKPHKVVPTFARDVAPILYAKCANCHHAGEVAPFSLTNYEEARAKAKTIVASTERKLMPPWQAVSHGEFQDERTLSATEIETLKDWADGGAPAGDLKKAPPSPTFTPGWMMGTPDFVGGADRPYPIAGEGADDYRCFIIPTHYSEDKYVAAVELRPGNRKVVHHVLIYVDSNGLARKIQSKDGKPGYASFGGPGFPPTNSLGGWAPGLQPNILGPGAGFLLPKGADIVLQLHYHKDGKPETDLTKIGLKFAKGPVDKEVRWNAIGEQVLDIPPGNSAYPVTTTLTLPRDLTVLDVIPHMHWLGHDMTVTATFPDGTKKSLIDVSHYDFNWQTRYTYKEPVKLPKGTVLTLVAHYDNSKGNPRNPNNPPKPVTFGEQTTNEMCFAFFSYTLDKEHLAQGVRLEEKDDFGLSDNELDKMFDKFDADHDGFLEAPELAALIRYFSGEAPSTDGKPTKSDNNAKMAVMFYGKAHKGALTRDEFMKLVKTQNK